jgi:type VI secretion system protein ImpF
VDDEIRLQVPLFDRLAATESTAPFGRPGEPLDLDGLRESLRRELERLLNSRCSLSAQALVDRDRTVVDYGIPDLAHVSPKDSSNRDAISFHIKQAVEAFEPRLRRVTVTAEEIVDEDHSLRVRIEAELLGDRLGETVSFDVHATKDGRAEVRGGA